jgi:hypothetical protein
MDSKNEERNATLVIVTLPSSKQILFLCVYITKYLQHII